MNKLKRIEFTNRLKEFELTYWRAHRHEKNIRSSVMVSLFGDCVIDGKIAADIGRGPNCGIFNELKFDVMYAVDPLWDEYKENDLVNHVDGAILINSMAEDFVLDEKLTCLINVHLFFKGEGLLDEAIDNCKTSCKVLILSALLLIAITLN